ncbi:hypothetical protein TRV_02529 [Trichophyton verrucosum HKI 0517]|uniref:Uncharacterized protein n=1 Tax=Trichophyton verrucosum (strain HKI 0517) TaxID=663202 RepID=D4D606_TRIVH|nr:uncharacterized protein TRV_02529 [Trichophyton verrucosum HKI 0517]EFE42715.1 hypothetical protein TRV_02529 [Trichophyton verrucosum HKI 0517]
MKLWFRQGRKKAISRDIAEEAETMKQEPGKTQKKRSKKSRKDEQKEKGEANAAAVGAAPFSISILRTYHTALECLGGNPRVLHPRLTYNFINTSISDRDEKTAEEGDKNPHHLSLLPPLQHAVERHQLFPSVRLLSVSSSPSNLPRRSAPDHQH